MTNIPPLKTAPHTSSDSTGSQSSGGTSPGRKYNQISYNLFKCTPVDIMILMFGVIVFILSLAGGITGYMVLQNQAYADANATFVQRSRTVAATINGNMASALSNYLILKDMLSLFGSVNYYTKFKPFSESVFKATNGSTNLPPYISFIFNIDIVKQQDLATYTDTVQSWGGSYQNFSNIYAFGTRSLDLKRSEYYLQSQTIPSNVISLGNNCGSNPYLNITIKTAIVTSSPTTTMRINFPDTTGGGVGVMVFTPMYQEGQPIGVLAAGIETTQLLKESVSLKDGEGVAIYDSTNALLGATTSASGVYTNYNSDTDVKNILSSAVVVNKNNNCTVLNNTWKVVFFSTTSLPSSLMKAVPLIVCILFIFVFETMIVFIYGYRKMVLSKRAQDKARNRVEVLENHRAKLSCLLKQSLKSEEKVRSILNSIPDLVIVINSVGKISQCNNSFDNCFTYSEKEWVDGVNIGDILCDLKRDFFLTQEQNVAVNTCAQLRNGDKMNVEVKVAAMTSSERTDIAASPLSDSGQPLSLTFEEVDEEAYLILIRRSDCNI